MGRNREEGANDPADGRGDQVTKQEQTAEKEAAESQCTHHWLIDKPNGPTSQAACKLCGERAEFRNSMPGTGWDRDSQQRKRAAQQRQNRR